jgi:N-hydroxyarylamine O-acetyltransferase
MKPAEVQKYLQRIGFNEVPATDLQSLVALQRNHLLSVPFENLDIHLHNPIILDAEKFYDKIVIHKRGGFCYELNGLFNELLIEIGFNTRMVSAMGFQTVDKYSDEFDHLAILVELVEGKYITDVGFGEFSFNPLRFECRIDQKDERGIFTIEHFDEQHFIIRKTIDNNNWTNEYIFSETSRSLEDFTEMCRYHQSSPNSHFTKKMICSIATPNGRITVTEKSVKITHNGEVKETSIANHQEFKKALKYYFNIDLQFPSPSIQMEYRNANS